MDIVFLSLEQSIITYVSINRDTILLSRAMHLRIILTILFYMCLRFISNPQCTERTLNKIAKAINETFAPLNCMPQGIRIYFV